MESLDGIYERMRGAYAQASGWEPDAVSDTGLKLRVLAGELYRFGARLEWLERQAFPQTADGERLDMHGAQRGVARRGSRKAQGVLAFSRYIPISFDLVIPKGTLCASSGEEAVEYETTEEGILAAGEVTVSVPAQAVAGGKKGNAAAGCVNTLVTEVNGVNYVTNTAAFAGGQEPEDDGSYRTRVMEASSLLGHLGSAAWYEALALEREGITMAQAVPREAGPGTVSVYVWGEGAAPDEQALAALAETLDLEREAGVTVTVKTAQSKKVSVMGSIQVKPGAVFSQARDRAAGALKDWFSQRKIGDAVYLGDLNRVILDADPAVSKVTFNNVTTGLAAAAGVLPLLGGSIISEDK